MASPGVFAYLPLLTMGLVVFLVAVFFVQTRLAFVVGTNSAMSHESLLALGAASYDMVVGARQVWRIFLAPLLHLDGMHLLGNCFALAFIGGRLELLIGRPWLTAIFAISALGGIIGSLFGNAHDVATVGASGAISGLIGALFVMSYFSQASAEDQYKMRRSALRFGVPALLPLAFGASGHTDYFAHLGGAMTGGLIGLALGSLWTDGGHRPAFGSVATKITGAYLAASVIACGFAAADFSAHSARSAQLIPQLMLPGDIDGIDAKVVEKLSRYPNDPRYHLIRAAFFLKANSLGPGEDELNKALELAPNIAGGQKAIENTAKTYLAILLATRFQTGKARELVRAICTDTEERDHRKALAEMKLCD